MRPRKDREAQIDGCRVQRIGGLLQFHGKAVGFVECPGRLDQVCCEVGVNAPIAGFVGIGQRALGNMTAYAQVVEFGLMGAQAGFDVAQALAVSQLRESHAEKLVEMRKSLGRIFGRIPLYAAAKCVKGQVRHELREYQLA